MNERLHLTEEHGLQPLTTEKEGFNQFHISLSKLFFLRHFQIDSFVNSLRQSIKVKPFTISLSGSQLFTNEDKSRSFCSILVQKGFHSIIQLIKQIDSILTKFKKEVYYNPPVPHCTVGSCIGDLSEQAKEEELYGNEYKESDEYDSDDENLIEFTVDSIHVSIGNQDYEISLSYPLCLHSLNSCYYEFF